MKATAFQRARKTQGAARMLNRGFVALNLLVSTAILAPAPVWSTPVDATEAPGAANSAQTGAPYGPMAADSLRAGANPTLMTAIGAPGENASDRGVALSIEPIAIAAGPSMSNPAVSLAVEIPTGITLAGPEPLSAVVAADLEWSTADGTVFTHLNVNAAVRGGGVPFLRRAYWALGLSVAGADLRGAADAVLFGAGPLVELGWTSPVLRSPVFVEPFVAASYLAGVRIDRSQDGGVDPVTNGGFATGLRVGYRFGD